MISDSAFTLQIRAVRALLVSIYRWRRVKFGKQVELDSQAVTSEGESTRSDTSSYGLGFLR